MKNLWIALLAFALLGTSQGPLFSTHAFDGTGDITWANASNAQVEDGVFATCATGAGVGNELWSDAFGFSIPGTATITGIQSEVKCKSSIAGETSQGIGVLQGGAGNGDVLTITVSTTLTWMSVGGDGTLFSLPWAPADINSSGFGGRFSSASNDNTQTLSVDAFRITVFYTLPATKKKQVIGSLEHHAQTSYGGIVTDKITGETNP